MSTKIITSIKIEKALWKEAKKKAIDEGKTLAEFLGTCIREHLKCSG